jgi:hypothetical protein
MDKKVIPIFLDWTGTINELLNSNSSIGAEKLKSFFDSIKRLELESDSRASITIVTGSALNSAKKKFFMLWELAKSYDMPGLFEYVVAEYCGHMVDNWGEIKQLSQMQRDLIAKQSLIDRILKDIPNCRKNDAVTTYTNILFDDNISKDKFDIYVQIIKTACGLTFDYTTCFDEYGKELDIKSSDTNKKVAVEKMIQIYTKENDIRFIVTGGDTIKEDVPMAQANTGNIPVIPIAPGNHDITADIINKFKIIVGQGQNYTGIGEAIDEVTTMQRR